jgi:hypothetical protein
MSTVAASGTDHTIRGASFPKRDQMSTVAASGTDHTIRVASFPKRDQINPYLVTFEETCSPDCISVPQAATTVLCTPDDGRDGRPKHVE